MLRFLDRWAQFEGGDEEIYPNGGVQQLIADCLRKSGIAADALTR
ncbi:MAG TPA: hypothetical protein VIW24_16835 [Aldersonia sp.]